MCVDHFLLTRRTVYSDASSNLLGREHVSRLLPSPPVPKTLLPIYSVIYHLLTDSMISPGKQESMRLVLLTLNILEEKKKKRKKTSFLPINYKIHILRWYIKKKKKPDINVFLLCCLDLLPFILTCRVCLLYTLTPDPQDTGW